MEIIARNITEEELITFRTVDKSYPNITNEGYPITYLQLSDGKKELGTFCFNTYNEINSNKGLYIRGLYVNPEIRHKGIGSKIIKQFIINALTENKFIKIKLEALDSENFWNNLGFIKTTNKAVEGDICMEYPLTKTLITKN